MADQHRADVMGCAGDPTVHTPNLDRLAAEGVRFSRTSCQGPLCMPARASFLTERYVRDHGVYTNWAEVGAGSPTYLHALREAGYHTAMIGKAHLTRDDDRRSPVTSTTLADRLEERGFAEVHETGDKFSIDPPNRYIDHLRERGMLDAYAQHIADRSYQGERETGRGRDEAGADVGRDAVAVAARRLHRHLARRPRGRAGSSTTTSTSRSSRSSASRARTTRGTRRRPRSTSTPRPT